MEKDFKSLVFEIVAMIPEGHVTTYGAVANAIGFPKNSRAVGKAMGFAKNLPAHRVVASGGIVRVSEFIPRLEKEGITCKNSRIVGFKNIFWNPLDEI